MVGLGLRAGLVEPAAGGDVDLAAKDRLETPVSRVIVKDHRRKHIAVLCHGKRRHLELDGFVQELVDAACAVEERKLGVQVKVNELVHPYSHSIVDGGFDEMS